MERRRSRIYLILSHQKTSLIFKFKYVCCFGIAIFLAILINSNSTLQPKPSGLLWRVASVRLESEANRRPASVAGRRRPRPDIPAGCSALTPSQKETQSVSQKPKNNLPDTPACASLPLSFKEDAWLGGLKSVLVTL